MAAILDKDFTKVWQGLKKNAGIKSSPWFKKADAAVSKKVEAYQKALAKAKSGLAEDLLKVGEALTAMEQAFTKFVDAKGLDDIAEKDLKKAEKTALVNEIKKYKLEVTQERVSFDAKWKKLSELTGGDIKKIQALEASKKKELWKEMGVEL
jgi:hypothetical protein